MQTVNWSIGENVEGLFTAHTQEISTKFLTALKETRADLSSQVSGDLLRLFSIPAIFVHKWLKEGFDIMRESEKAIERRLKAEGLDHFIATDKQI